MSNNSVVFNTTPQIEVILKSISLEDSILLEPILNSTEIDNQEKSDIRKYLKLLEVSGNPSVLMLQKEIPGRNFEVDSIDKEAIPDYIQLYLYSKKNLETSKMLMDLSTRIRSEGLTEEIIDRLSSLTKSDSVKHSFTNIKDTLIKRYEDTNFSKGIPTGITFVDEMTGGVHKGELSVFAGFAGHRKNYSCL